MMKKRQVIRQIKLEMWKLTSQLFVNQATLDMLYICDSLKITGIDLSFVHELEQSWH